MILVTKTSDQTRVCACVCCHPIYSGHQACGRTSRGHTGGRPHSISPLSFCGACLNFLAKMIQPFLSLVVHEVDFFCVCVSVCVCVFFSFILDIKFVGCTSRGHTDRRKITCLYQPGSLIHLLPSAVHAFSFLARRIQPFLSFVDREVEICVLTI